MKSIILFLSFLLLLGFCFAEEKAEGDFRDLTWGTPFSELQDQLVKSSNKMPRFKSYELKNDVLEYEGIAVHLISYGFRKGKLEAVSVGLYNKDVEAVVAVLTEKYGEPKKVETPLLMNWEWHPERSDIAVSYFPTKKGDKGAAIGFSKSRSLK